MSTGIKGKCFQNWAQTYKCYPERYFEPRTFEEVKDILSSAVANEKRVKIVGIGHSPSNIACTNDYMISFKNLNKIIDVYWFKL